MATQYRQQKHLLKKDGRRLDCTWTHTQNRKKSEGNIINDQNVYALAYMGHADHLELAYEIIAI